MFSNFFTHLATAMANGANLLTVATVSSGYSGDMVSPNFCLSMNSRRNQLLHIALLISFGCGTNTFEDLTLGLDNIDQTFFIIFLTFLDQTTNQLIKKIISFSSGCIILKLQKNR